MSDQTIVDVVINDSTATVVDNRDLSNLTIDLNATGQLLTNNLISSGNYLDSEIAIVSGIAQSGSNESLTGQINQLSGNLITTGQTLQTQITSNDSDINTLTTNLATTGETLTSEINSISGVVPTGGATNQVLAKIDSTDYNTQWVDQSGGGGGSGTVTSSTATTNYLTKWTNGAGEVIGNSILYDNGSNIGIGTTSPSSKLHVEGTFKNTGETFLATDSTNEVIIGASITGGSLPNKFLNITGYDAFGIKLIAHGGWTKYLIQTGHDRRLRFYNDGTSSAATNQNFLFGTISSGSAKLTLFTKNASFIHLGVNEPYPSAKFGVLNPTHDYKGDVYIDTASAAGAYKRFQFKNTGVFDTEAVNATSTSVNSYFSANVGIGTISPSSKLHALTSGGSTTSENVVAIFQANTSSAISSGGGTAIKFKGVSSGGNQQNYDQGMISTFGYSTNNMHGMKFYYKPNSSTALTEGMRLNSSGFLSVGGHEASEKLHVYGGNIAVDNTYTIGGVNGSTGLSVSGSTLTLKTGNVDRAKISDDKFTIGGTVYSSLATVFNVKDSQDSSFNSGIGVFRSSGAEATYLNMVGGNFNLNAPTGASTQFKVAGTNTLTIVANGNVGIGTTNPSSKLHVNGMISAGIAGNNSANYAALLVSSTGTGTQQSAIAIQQTYPNGNTIIWADLEPYAEYNFSHDGIDNAFTFNSGYYANSLRTITIRNRSGAQRISYEKVKIWQNTAQVDVGGAISIGQLGTGAVTHPTIRLTIKDLQDSSFNSGIALVRSTNTDTAYINMVGGNLNFNAPTGASTQFKVAGTNTFAIAANGSISSSTGASLSSGGTWTDASTRELKQDIKDLDYRESLNIIKQLNPVKFAYKKDPKNKKIGFIAEDVPDLVATEDRKGLSALQIVSALTKVVQSQQKEIQQLKRMVKRLNNIK